MFVLDPTAVGNERLMRTLYVYTLLISWLKIKLYVKLGPLRSLEMILYHRREVKTSGVKSLNIKIKVLSRHSLTDWLTNAQLKPLDLERWYFSQKYLLWCRRETTIFLNSHGITGKMRTMLRGSTIRKIDLFIYLGLW